MIRVDVELGAGSYPIHVVDGGLEGLGTAVSSVAPAGRCVVVTNPVVGALYLDAAVASLARAGWQVEAVEVPDGEVHKTLDTWRALVDRLVALRVDRHTPVVALGGGVTGDLAGFAAATALRGVPLVQVPTTLLAMVDSSVGGKTGVNTPHGKNLVGAFHQPVLVYAPLQVLETLALEERRAGMAEVVKHALIGDAPLLELLEARGKLVLAGADPAGLAECVARSAELKARIVGEDELEHGARALLNFGHTAGHAVEALGKGSLRHGDCVALGMGAELRHGEQVGRTARGLAARYHRLCATLGLPTTLPWPMDHASLVAAAAHDKKRIRGTLRLPVVAEVGHARCVAVHPDEVAEMLHHLDVTVPRGELDRTVAVSEDA